jgi:hypothetical protein
VDAQTLLYALSHGSFGPKQTLIYLSFFFLPDRAVVFYVELESRPMAVCLLIIGNTRLLVNGIKMRKATRI